MADYSLKEFSISETLGKSWQMFKDNWKELIIFAIVYMLAIEVPMIVVTKVFAKMEGVMMILQLALTVWNLYVFLGAMKYMLAFMRGQKPELAKMFDNTQQFVPFLIMYIRYALVIFGGMICLIIPGIYFSFKYAYVLILVADGKADGSEAFVMSGKMTEGRKLTMFLYGLVGFVLIMLGTIAFLLPGFIAGAVVGLGGLLMYQYLLDHASSAPKAA